jgi:polysaccharide export outer membrane protein
MGKHLRIAATVAGLAAGLVLAGVRPAIAQEAPTTVAASSSGAASEGGGDFVVRPRQRIISPEEVVRQFEGPEMTSYTLGDGDEITVDVWSHPELSGHHVVGPDGKITLPISGVLKVADLSREEAQKAINDALSRYYSDLAVTVRVDRYTSYRILVLGRVGVPGVLQFDSQPTLLDVVTRADSLPISGVGSDKAGLGRCAIIRGHDKMLWIDLKAMLVQGNMALNIRLERNDLVYMPDPGDQSVYVLGEVKHPGAFRLTPTMTFLDAFSLAGGLTEDAKHKKILLIHSVTGVQREFSQEELLSAPQNFNFALEEGDIIFAPRSGLAKFGYALQKTATLAAFAVLGTAGK